MVNSHCVLFTKKARSGELFGPLGLLNGLETMKTHFSKTFVATPLILGCAFLAISPLAAQNAPKMATSPAPKVPAVDWKTPLSGEKRVAHVLNRMAFGPRPGEIAQIQKSGLDAWIASQLSPQKIADERVEAQIKKLALLRADSNTLRLAYEGDSGQVRRALEARMRAENGAARPNRLQNVGAAPQVAPQAQQRMQEVLNARQQQTLEEYEASGLLRGSSVQAIGELSSAKLVRATNSNRQLQEVLADFWSNHFNVDVRKGPVRAMKIADERDAIRPHLFGNFREMLGASAKSPAMLWYLDNYRSTAQITMPNGNKRGGLNENYARELMELHTLGVDGGYSQKDVTEVARAFTGWGIGNGAGARREARRNGRNRAQNTNANAQNTPARAANMLEFRFNAAAHDNGPKEILGVKLPANGGQKDGETVLDLLAAHPSTAKFIARKLCVRFIADEPPASAVNRVAKAFSDSNGDLPTVYRALFTSPEFGSVGAYRAKIKSPFEFAVSAARALGGQFSVADPANPRQRMWLVSIGSVSVGQNNRAQNLPRRPIAAEIANMGQPLWACSPPTGWSENSQTWVSSSALVARLNFALSLTSGKIGDIVLTQDTLRAAPLDDLARDLLGGDIAPATRAVVTQEIEKSPSDGAKIRALLLGSPEFQRR